MSVVSVPQITLQTRDRFQLNLTEGLSSAFPKQREILRPASLHPRRVPYQYTQPRKRDNTSHEAVGRLSDSQHRFSKGHRSAGRRWQGQQLSLLELSGLGVGPCRDRRHTALAGIIPLSSQSTARGLFLGGQKPNNNCLDLKGTPRISFPSALTPSACRVALLLFLFPMQRTHPKPSLLRSDLPPGS